MTAVQRAKQSLARLSEMEILGVSVGRAFNEVVPSRGLRIDTRELAPSIKSQLLFRTYESSEIRAVRRYLRSDLDVIELGASIGVLSCHIRRKLQPTRRLYCVEANERAAKMIPVNLELNRLNDNVTVIHAALAYGDCETQFRPSETNISGRIGEESASSSVSVPAITLETLIRNLSIGEYALVCDIEGSEAEMIIKDASALRKCAQMIIELHPSAGWSNPDDLIALLCGSCNFSLLYRQGGVCVLERR